MSSLHEQSVQSFAVEVLDVIDRTVVFAIRGIQMNAWHAYQTTALVTIEYRRFDKTVTQPAY